MFTQLVLLSTLLLPQDSELAALQSQVRQRESEAAVLGQQLQRQTAELEEVLQGAGSRDETQRLLQQANADVVRSLKAKQLFEASL